MHFMPQDENDQKPEELKEFENLSGETGSEYYYRGSGARGANYGSSDKLQALSDGYFGMNWVFLANVVIVVASRVGGALLIGPDESSIDPATALVFFFGTFAVLFLVVSIATFPFNKKIGVGRGWSPFGAVFASFLLGLNSALCCGVIGYVVMQMIASTEMKKYGIKTTFFGLKKKVIKARIDEIRQFEASLARQT